MPSPRRDVDWEGLVVAFESRSRQITHFFDRQTGDVVQVLERDAARHARAVGRPALRRAAARRGRALARRPRGVRGALRGRGVPPRPRGGAGAAAIPHALSHGAPASSPKEEARFFQFKERRARERAQAWLAEIGIPFRKPEREPSGRIG